MPEDITMPMIAIGGGSALLVMVLCIFWFATRSLASRRRARREARHTSFHAVVIDPRIAALGRAAFEDTPRPLPVDAYVPQPRPDMRVPMHYLQREPQPRMARGSTPGIATAPAQHVQYTHGVPAEPVPLGYVNDWDVPTTPSATAPMRTYRRR